MLVLSKLISLTSFAHPITFSLMYGPEKKRFIVISFPVESEQDMSITF